MKITDIKAWIVGARINGVGCVLVRTESGWNTTACGMYTPNGGITNTRPSRMCTQCRGALYKLQPVKKDNRAEGAKEDE
jgi:hypothetical protein